MVVYLAAGIKMGEGQGNAKHAGWKYSARQAENQQQRGVEPSRCLVVE